MKKIKKQTDVFPAINFLYLLHFVLYYILLTLGAVPVYAQSDVYLSVRAGGSSYIPVGIGGFTSSDLSSPLNEVGTVLESDVMNSGLFVITPAPETAGDASGGSFEQWKEAGAKYYIFGTEIQNGRAVSVDLIDLNTLLTVQHEEYRIEEKRPWYTAHVIADDLIQHFAGLRGGMASQVAFIRRTGDTSELYIMDADGRNVRQVTFSKTMLMSPSWSADGSQIAYCALNAENWLLMMLNVNTGQSVDISRWPGLNTTPDWSPVHTDVLAFSSSRDGNAEIYTCTSGGGDIRRLTNHRRIDSNPSWSPDGSKIAFTSDRTGNPLIYVMNSDGSGAHRLTSTPNAYEDSPCWSPRGDRIVFVMMSDYGFDIATSSSTGDDVLVLTFAQGSNEDPRWSPDGLRIIFTSTRVTGTKRLFTMNWDGSNPRPLTIDGNNYSPAWAPAVSGNDVRITSQR